MRKKKNTDGEKKHKLARRVAEHVEKMLFPSVFPPDLWARSLWLLFSRFWGGGVKGRLNTHTERHAMTSNPSPPRSPTPKAKQPERKRIRVKTVRKTQQNLTLFVFPYFCLEGKNKIETLSLIIHQMPFVKHMGLIIMLCKVALQFIHSCELNSSPECTFNVSSLKKNVFCIVSE